MKITNQHGRDPHQEFMEWIAAIVASLPACAVDPERPSTSDQQENTKAK